MIVRCGRCQAELDVAGEGEFMCPACGTRNVVRGPAPQREPFGVPDLTAGIANPSADPSEPAPGVSWTTCPACTYRFAVGEVEEVNCPACAAHLSVSGDRVEEIP